ncbi:HNH endonuclease [bacterium]|nr:HNH endonuclease [Akkermansiaceae bacterium]MDB4422184.1 HNH endonuclease [Akkermansiaceae bacterium]MDB4515909.1 HNH endonuclease [Akkermansiaceae bacterium]MDB4617706.1 HNH endonuclease [bacterium]
MYLRDDDGILVESEFSFGTESGFPCVIIESSGGSKHSAGIKRRNAEYNTLLNILFQRILNVGAQITQIILDSRLVASLPVGERIAQLDQEYPIDLAKVEVDEFRRMVGRAIATMHRKSGAESGGNAQKRIRICLDRIVSSSSLITHNGAGWMDDEIVDYAPGVDETEREYLRKARVGQGKFRKELLSRFNSTCPVTGIQNSDLLVASHIKPWKICTSKERLDPNNGILLSALIDRLFDKGLITFGLEGKVLFSCLLEQEDRSRCGLDSVNQLNLSAEAKKYMEYHRAIEFQNRLAINPADGGLSIKP